MTDFEANFAHRQTLNARFARLFAFENIIIAVSGGSDSMALLHLVCYWKRIRGDARLPRMIAVTVDHGLRPEAADEARQVCTWCCALGVEHRRLTWRGEKPVSAIQDFARKARYRLIGDLVRRLSGRSLVLTGHTRDDQAETLLMRLARGSGPEGLAGIATFTQAHGYDLHRPLLDLTREGLRKYLCSIDVGWLDDPSNESAAFERVRVRQNTQARLALGLNDAALARTAWRMARAHSALDDAADRFLLQIVKHDDNLRHYGVFTWDRRCRELSDEIAIRVLRRVIFCIGGQTDFPSLGQTEKLFQKISGEDFTGATLAGCRSVPAHKGGMRKGGEGGAALLFFREHGREMLPRTILSESGDAIWDHRFCIRLNKTVAGKEVEIAAVGENLSVLRKMSAEVCAMPLGIPSQALEMLPGLYANDELIAVPSLSWRQSSYGASVEFMARRLLRHDRTVNPDT